MPETLRVLVTDDEAQMRLAVTRALHNYRLQLTEVPVEVCFHIDQALSAEEALAKAVAAPPDILLLDHKLPGMSGLDLLNRLGADPRIAPDMLTIMLTAYASLETAVAAIKCGAHDFLAKPFTPTELRATLGKAAGRLVLTRQARKLAKEKRQVRFEFISVLAHELKAPLAAIEGYLNILRDRAAGDSIAAYSNMVDRSIIRMEGMRKLISDLLDLTRIESGQKNRQLTQVNLAEVARKAVESFQPEAQRRSIALTLQAAGPPTMTADAGEIEIILNNLIANAVKYNRDGGGVNISLAAEGGVVILAVADTGIGIKPEDAARLFQDFVRIKNDKTRDILGSGLGLSIVKKLAMLYGGDVAVESAPGLGTTFTVRLQQHPGDTNEPAGNTQLAPGG